MEVRIHSPQRRIILAEWISRTGIVLFILATAAIVYFDDIQITKTTAEEVATIYNKKLFGLKIIDIIALCLTVNVCLYLLLRREVTTTYFHKMVGIIFLVYCYAAFVGFVYSFFLRYDYLIWLQDFQPVIYLTGFFLITYYLLDSRKKWKIYTIAFLSFLALKNLIIFYRTFYGVGILIGSWAFRASQNSEFAYFPMMFFPLLILLMTRKQRFMKGIIAVILAVYLFNALLGIVRTVWVMLIIGGGYLLFQVDRRTKAKLIGLVAFSLIIVISGIQLLFPKFLDLAWNYKFTSIFNWSLVGDRSNATRILEIINVTNYVFRHYSFFQGMGLGAWWDDSAHSLLPDYGSGFMFKTRYYGTHMMYVTQLLKIGIVGLIFYWYAIYRIFSASAKYIKKMEWHKWEKSVLLGLNVGLLCAIVSSADFVRLFLIMGINIGIIAAFTNVMTTQEAR